MALRLGRSSRVPGEELSSDEFVIRFFLSNKFRPADRLALAPPRVSICSSSQKMLTKKTYLSKSLNSIQLKCPVRHGPILLFCYFWAILNVFSKFLKFFIEKRFNNEQGIFRRSIKILMSFNNDAYF